MYSGEFAEPRLLHSKGFIQLCVDKSATDNTGYRMITVSIDVPVIFTSFLSVGTDGDIWVWTGDELDEAEYYPKNINGRTHCAIAWHRNDIYIGYTNTDDQTGVQKSTVSRFEKGDIVRIEIDGQIMCVSFNSKDEYLAVTATDGMLRVFDMLLLKGNEIPEPVTFRICSRIIDIEPSNSRLQLCWDPSGDSLFVPVLGCVKNSADEMFSICCVSPCGIYLASSTMNGLICVWRIENGDLLTCSKYAINGQPKVICAMFWHQLLQDTLFFADTEEHICSLSKCTTKAIPNDCNNRDLDLQSEKTELPQILSLMKIRSVYISADLGSIKKSFGFDEEGHFHGITDENKKNPYIFSVTEPLISYKPLTVPKTFVTGSTPEYERQRYLKWNRYGTIISSYKGDDARIEINWHDSSVHPEIIIDNSLNFSVGDMTDEIVHCIKAWDYGSRQWKITLPEGPLLTMCAFNDMFTAVMLKGGAYYEDDEPQFNFIATIYKMKTEGWHKCQSLAQTVPVSVSRNAKLNWIGYTNRGTLCAMDSKFCCRILTSNGIWIPVYDFTNNLKIKSDHIFLISFMDYPHCEVRYIYCRGREYPLVESRSVTAIVKWQLPLCNQDSEKSKLEEKLLLAEIRKCALSDEDDNEKKSEFLNISTAYTKDVVRLFALACKADRQCRAAEFAAYTHSGQIVQSMCNFASKTRHPLLAEKERDSDELIIKTVRQEPEQENERMHELVSTLSSESSSAFSLSIRPKLSSNPFKRKSQTTFGSSEDSFFDSLASASATTLRKRMMIIESSEVKTGFKLWLESVECKLRANCDGSDDFLEYAIRQFRLLNTEEKQSSCVKINCAFYIESEVFVEDVEFYSRVGYYLAAWENEKYMNSSKIEDISTGLAIDTKNERDEKPVRSSQYRTQRHPSQKTVLELSDRTQPFSSVYSV
ncbi:hypothetical protein DINM_022911 [Dirofilaria immitis]|nr:hypothetical protein [Dirofilaria immitis]